MKNNCEDGKQMDGKKQEVRKTAAQAIGEMWSKVATGQIPWLIGLYFRALEDNK